MANYLPNGVGGATGSALATTSSLYTSEVVRYVDSTSGSDSYTGLSRDFPYATVKAAVDASAAHDIVVVLSGHSESVSTAIPVDVAGLRVIAEGSSSGQPTVALSLPTGSNNIFTVTASDCAIENFRFSATAAATGNYINADGSSDGLRISGCYVQVDGYNDAVGVSLATACDRCHILNTTFISTATAAGTLPRAAMSIGGAITAMRMDGCTFDGGTVGFDSDGDGTANPYAFDGSAGAITGLHAENLTLNNGAVFKLHASTLGHVAVPTATGGGRVEW